MPAAFGFSVGDFIAALNLVATVIDALREVEGASAEFRGLLRELHTLETALLRVKRVELDDSQSEDRVALQQAAWQCQRMIDEFWTKVQKYQPHLGILGSSSRYKDGWMKIKWKLCRGEDLVKFKADVRDHATPIGLLLMTVQMNHANLQNKKQELGHQTLAGRLQLESNQYMARLAILTDTVASGIKQSKQLLGKVAKIERMSVEILQLVYSMNTMLKRIPWQIERQQPVYMIDALGRSAPFHLEFIRSSEALIWVLKTNFRKIPSGPRKIERGEFTFQDTGSKRLINLNHDWDTCFLPGQRVEMSMVFKFPKVSSSSCPSCKAEYKTPTDESQDIECSTCGLSFCRITDRSEEGFADPRDPSDENLDVFESSQHSLQELGPCSRVLMHLKRKREGEEEDDNDPRVFRRVRILEKPVDAPLARTPRTADHVCVVPGCHRKFLHRADVEYHTMVDHFSPARFDCSYPTCNRKGRRGFPRKDKLLDHERAHKKIYQRLIHEAKQRVSCQA